MLARTAYGCAMASYAALFVLLLAWLTVLAPPPKPLISLSLLVLMVPLLLPLRGLLRGRRYTFAWSTLLILAYFAHGVAGAASVGLARWLGLGEIALSLVFFGSAIIYIRSTRSARH